MVGPISSEMSCSAMKTVSSGAHAVFQPASVYVHVLPRCTRVCDQTREFHQCSRSFNSSIQYRAKEQALPGAELPPQLNSVAASSPTAAGGRAQYRNALSEGPGEGHPTDIRSHAAPCPTAVHECEQTLANIGGKHTPNYATTMLLQVSDTALRS